jgi:hypothetical protein
MAERVYNQPMLQAPVQKAIPQGIFFDIDQKYYEPKPENETKERHLRPHGTNVNLQSEFVEAPTPLALQTGSLIVNYGSYIYQQRTGWDAAHVPPDMTFS